MNTVWRRFGIVGGLCLASACGESPTYNNSSFSPGASSAGDSEDDDDDDDDDQSADDDDDDDDDNQSPDDDDDDDQPSSGTTSGGNATAFDTLTTEPPGNATADPTNSSGDTNDTGSASVTISEDGLVDDMEDGDAVIYERGGRIGVWYSYNDATAGTMNPAAMQDFVVTAGGPNESTYAAHVRGSGFTSWGAGIGFDVNNAGGTRKGLFDASGFRGIAFQVRTNVMLRFKIQTGEVVPTEQGGTCTAGDSCNDAYGFDVQPSTTWRQVAINFSELSQANWGQQAPWNASTVMGFQWEVTANQSFEFAIDDVGFF